MVPEGYQIRCVGWPRFCWTMSTKQDKAAHAEIGAHQRDKLLDNRGALDQTPSEGGAVPAPDDRVR